ncbi:unnamed protein product [Clonostachys rosea]|uniref:Uncharacterized protein n=1 Tax=Bionectria ochroleuca TaxID=29856 RepID=A0ABY6TT66_BIOOC|nr:unnamed protein product [Clonostachys rosea]
MADEFRVPFLGSVPIDAQFVALIEEGIRPTYPEGTVVNGRDISNAGQAGSKDGTLAEKYKDCLLFHLFQGITEQVVQAVQAGDGSTDYDPLRLDGFLPFNRSYDPSQFTTMGFTTIG